MKFEAPQANNLNKQEAEKANDFKKFLLDQISLPNEKWSKEFVDYIEEKRNEASKEESSEHLPDSELTYNRYLKGLELDEGDLKNKRILDLGCGEEGEFVKECIDKDLTGEIYGLDLEVNPDTFDENLKEHFFKKKFEDEFPVKNLDYVISVGALESPLDESDERKPTEILKYALEGLNDKGEIRIYPIRVAPPESGLEGIEYSRKKWDEIMNELASTENIKYKFKPIDIHVSANNEDVWLEEVLIIKK
jgi:hypothetical protein